VLGIVPKIALAARWQLVGILPPVDIVAAEVEVTAVVDFDASAVIIAVAPAVAPSSAESCAHRHARAEPHHRRSYITGWVISVWGIRRVRPRPIHHRRVIRRHVNDLRTGGLDFNDLLLDDDGLLFGRLEIP
jgi:hypothetical protein